MASIWKRRSVRIPIAILLALQALVGALATIGTWNTPDAGPLPSGTRLAQGVVLSYDASDGATAIVAEIRGLRTHPGAVRETLYVAREPFERDDFEALGRGATLGEISADGRTVSWLASKERGERTGPGRLRGIARDASPISQRALLPPVLFDRGKARAVALTGYQPSPGRGTLSHIDVDAGTSKVLSANVAAGAFGWLAAGKVFALRRPHNATHAEAVVLDMATPPELPLTSGVGWDDPAVPAFRISPDRRSVTIRLAADEEGRRALVRWTDGAEGLTPVAPDAAAWTLDRDGRAWWVSSADAALRAFREPRDGGAPVYLGEAAGRDPVSVHPLPSGAGAWLGLADRSCVSPAVAQATTGGAAIVAALARTRGGCLRMVLAGAGIPPPDVEGLRRVLSPPGGWPVVLLGPVEGHPALVAVGDPKAPAVVEEGGLLGTAFAPDGRHVAARIAATGGQRIVLVDLTTSTTTLLAEQAPEALLSWHGDALAYVWQNRWWRLDPRNGLYRVRPDPPVP